MSCPTRPTLVAGVSGSSTARRAAGRMAGSCPCVSPVWIIDWTSGGRREGTCSRAFSSRAPSMRWEARRWSRAGRERSRVREASTRTDSGERPDSCASSRRKRNCRARSRRRAGRVASQATTHVAAAMGISATSVRTTATDNSMGSEKAMGKAHSPKPPRKLIHWTTEEKTGMKLMKRMTPMPTRATGTMPLTRRLRRCSARSR